MIKIHLSRILGERRISQRKLADMAEVRPNTINLIYNEKIKRIDLDVLDRICEALNSQPGYTPIQVGDLIEYIPNEKEA